MSDPLGRAATVRELLGVLDAVDAINAVLSLLNRSVLGETSTGPEDEIGQIGATIAKNTAALTKAINSLKLGLKSEES